MRTVAWKVAPALQSPAATSSSVLLAAPPTSWNDSLSDGTVTAVPVAVSEVSVLSLGPSTASKQVTEKVFLPRSAAENEVAPGSVAAASDELKLTLPV